jgi:hypothetical protein
MNTEKLQKDFLSKLLNYRQKNKVCYCFKDDDIGLTDGIALYFMPKKQWLLNMENTEKHEPLANIKNLLELETNAVLAEQAPELLPSEGKSLLVHFFNGDVHVYVNQDLIKYFSTTAQYFISGEKKPVFVRENEKLVGIVLPVNRKKVGTDGSGKEL